MLGELFKAYDIRAIYPEKLDEAAAEKIGFACGQFLLQRASSASAEQQGPDHPKTVLVSRDMRPHSPSLAQSLIKGLRAAGAEVIDVGMCDTSMMYFAINHLGVAGGIQTTASHNPIQYNGFKISGLGAKPIGADTGLKEIQAIAESLSQEPNQPPKGGLEERDLWDEYRKHILRFYKPTSRKIRVFIDGCNGMAGKLVPKVFSGLPQLEILPLNFEITGKFVHEPNPLVKENVVPTQQGVVRNRADLGVCFDGDADRCILTDEKGQIIGCDHLTALLAGYFLEQSPGSTIVYDLRSSKAVEQAVREHGGQPLRSRVGHVFMKAALRECGGVFGGELSGHFYFRDNFFADSGAITFAAVLSVLGQTDRPMSQLIGPFRKYPQSGEMNYRVGDKNAIIADLRKEFGGVADLDELDGITVDAWNHSPEHLEEKAIRSGAFGGNSGGGWWFNVRASNTEPLLRLNAEARDGSTLSKLLERLGRKLGQPVQGH